MRKQKMITAVFLSIAVLFSSVLITAATDLNEQLEDAQQESDALQQEMNSAESQLEALTAQLTALNTAMDQTQANITAKLSEITATENELISAKLDEENQYNAMKLRIRYMYEQDEVSLLTVALQAEDIADFLNKAEYVELLSAYDRDMLLAYQETVQTVEETQERLQTEYEELTLLETQLAEDQAAMEELVTEQEDAIATIEAKLGENSEEVASLQAQLAAYNARVAAEATQAAKNSASGKVVYSGNAGASVISGSGEFAHPCPTGTVSSTFGYRTFDNSFHKGLDFAAPAGTPIYAAESGTVVIAGYSASAGNWVVINHGNGLVTKYMHASVLYVKAGETVSKGQNIAGVGTTGYSTGNHLHFQVEVNGTAVNPQLYL